MSDISALGIKVTSNGVVKTTNELDKFAIAATAAGRAASKPLNVKVSGSAAKALADLKQLERVLGSVRSATSGLNIRIGSAGNAKAISDINRMGAALRDARAAARTPINVRITATGAAAAAAELNRFTQAANRARTASATPINARAGASGGSSGGPTNGDIGAVNSLKGAVLGLVGAYSLLQGAKVYASMTDGAQLLTAKLKLATAESGNFAQAQEDVRRIATNVRADLDSTAGLYGKLLLNSKQLGITQMEAARATETVAKAFKVSGASTVEAAQGTRQLVQALQSGVLRGDEFNTMAEAAPRLQNLLADSLGVTQGELRKMAAEGELTSDKLVKAFTDKRFTAALDEEFKKLPITLGDAMTAISNAATTAFGAFEQGSGFAKAIADFATNGTSDLKSIEQAFLEFGVSARSEVDGLSKALGPAISDLRELINLFSQGKQTADRGIFSTLFKELDAISAWYARNRWWISPGSVGPTSQTNLSKPYEDARQQRQRDATADQQNARLNAAGRWNGASGYMDAQKELPVVKAVTAAKKDASTASERLAERLARESEATEALIAGNLKAAAAYGESAAAGKLAEIQAEATAKGIKRQADVNEYAAQQVRKYVSELVKSQAEGIRQTVDQTAAQKLVNDQVAAGAINAQDAADALSMLNEQRALMNAIKLAKDDPAALEAAKNALAALVDVQIEANKERKRAQDLAAVEQSRRDVAAIEKEIALEERLGKERMKALRGLSGDALENELARINDERERAAILLEYEGKAAEAAAAGLTKYVEQLNAERDVRLKQLGQRQGQDAQERTFEQNRTLALNLAHDVANIIGGKLGSATSAMIDALDKAFPSLAADIGDKFGAILKSFSEGMKTGGAIGGLVGSKTGGALGGGLGQAAATQLFGEQFGPLGAIAGGLLGGIIGGMVKSTPRASATVSYIAGEAMETAIKGSSSQLKKIAGEMADGLISGLDQIAETLGAQLVGDASVSVGIRKKNYRVDTTGSGITKTSKGAIDFGEDKAAAIAFALQDAIKDGVLGGLSASLEKLITGDGDLETQLQKALNFKGVFDDLAQRDDPAKWAQDQVTKWAESMGKIFAEAGATGEELAALERLTGIKRAEAAKEAADQIAQQAREALETENKLASMRVALLELQGKSTEALALSRQIELSTMTEAEAAIQRQIHAEQDLATARDEAAAAEEAYVAARNQRWAEQSQLITRLLELEGDTAGLRQHELDKIDPTNRALQDLIWRREDEIAAAEAASAKLKAIADERTSLETAWLQAIGDEATLRQRALAQLDPSNRALQQQIWAYEDAQKAAQAEISARNDQIAAIQQTAQSLQGASDQYRDFAKSIREFRAGLFTTGNSSLGQVQGEFQRTSRMAAMGDAGALQGFQGSAQAFLDAALENATSLVDYQRALGLVAGAADAAAAGADGIANQAAAQYQALMDQIGQLEALNVQTQTNADTLSGLLKSSKDEVAPTLARILKETETASDKADATRAEEKIESLTIIGNLGELNSMLRQLIEAGGLNVRVINESTEPVRTLEVVP